MEPPEAPIRNIPAHFEIRYAVYVEGTAKSVSGRVSVVARNGVPLCRMLHSGSAEEFDAETVGEAGNGVEGHVVVIDIKMVGLIDTDADAFYRPVSKILELVSIYGTITCR